MNSNELKKFILEFYQSWKGRDAGKVAGFYDKNVKAYVDFKPVALQDMLNRLEFSQRKFLSADYNIQDLFVDEHEGKIAVRMKQHYVCRDDQEDISCESITLYKIADNKIAEIWMSFYPNVDYLDNT